MTPGFSRPTRVEAAVIAALEQLSAMPAIGPIDDEHVVRPDVLEIRRQHADDGVRDVVERQRSADDARVGAELRCARSRR